MGTTNRPFSANWRTSRRTRRDREDNQAVKYVPVRGQRTVQKKTQWCQVEVHLQGRWTEAVGRDTWRHMWPPHRRKGTCREGVPARVLLDRSPPRCNCTSNQV